MGKNGWTALVAALALAVSAGSHAAGADWLKDKPVTITVSVGPGGSTDLVARALAMKLGQLWNHNVVVENRPGASGIIAAEVVAQRPGDGHSFLLTHDGTITATSLILGRPDYKPLETMRPIASLASQDYAFVVNPKLAATNLAEFIAFAKAQAAKKNPLSFATSALGSADHLSGEQFRLASGVEMLVVPYKSTQPAITAVVGGHSPFGIFSFVAVRPLAQAGALKVLAVTGASRSAVMPDVPTLAETLPGFESHAWFGLFAPASMTPELAASINRDVNEAMKSPDVLEVLNTNGLANVAMGVDEFRRYIESDTRRTESLIRKAGLAKAATDK